jgi:hypothetical protein
MRVYTDIEVSQPAIFIGVVSDPSRFMHGSDRYANPINRRVDSRGMHMIDGVGHRPTRKAH